VNRQRGWRLGVGLAAAALVAVVVPAASQAQQAGHEETQAALDAYRGHAGPGAAVYAGTGTDTWTVNSGSAVVGQNRPIDPGDHFRAASQTKTFTATVVLQLVDEGLVELDAPIERYLPGVVAGNGYDGNKISVRQLLQHTSGISTDYANAKPQNGVYPLAELVRAGLSHPPQFEPGTSFGYSNVNYFVAGMLIEKITGQLVGDAITDRIITPLGLSGTRYPAPGDRSLAAPYLPGYTWQIAFWVDTTNQLEPSYTHSAGAMISTQADLVTFERALAGGKVVSAESLAAMRETVPVPGIDEFDYGVGLMHKTLSCGGEAWGHAGDLATGHTSLTMVTDDGRFASLVTNTMVTSEDLPTRYGVVETALCDGRAGP
jgi:D-alanyl-D-alanine carboxypeptidase